MALKKRSKIWISIGILMPILFVVYVVYGFVFHEKADVLNFTSFKEYKNDIKKQYPNIKELETYYRFGRITFDFKVKEISEDQYYKIIKETKNFVMELNTDEFAYTQATIRVTFEFDSNFYEFESPYWIQHSDGDLALPSTENNYEICYKTINGEYYEPLIVN